MADDSSEQAGACSLPFSPALVLSLPLSSSPFLLPLSLFLSSSSLLLAPALFLYSSRSRSLPLFLLSEYSSRSSSVPLFLKLPLCSSLPFAPALFLCPLAPTLFLCSSSSSSLPLFLLPLTLSDSRSLPLDPNVSPWILTSLPGSTGTSLDPAQNRCCNDLGRREDALS